MAMSEFEKLFYDFSCRRIPVLDSHVTQANQREMWRKSGIAIEKFLKGEMRKKQLLQTARELHRSVDWVNRFFPVATLDDLWTCLFAYTEDKTYANDQVAHEATHRDQMQAFRPSRSGESLIEVVYGVFIDSKGVITPYTCAAKRTFPYSWFPWSWGKDALITSFREQHRKEQDGLQASWHEDTIREYIYYLRTVVQERSEGDSLILGEG